RRSNTTRQVDRDPTRDEQQNQGHQSQSRKSKEPHPSLFLHEILIVAFRTRNEVCQIVRSAFLRRDDQHFGVIQRQREYVKLFSIHQTDAIWILQRIIEQRLKLPCVSRRQIGI